MRWPERPPHLAQGPLYLFFFVLFVCFLFGGFKGSGEVVQRATSLGPKPSLFVFGFFCFGRCCFSFRRQKKPRFPPKRVFLLIFQCPPLFLPSLFQSSFSLSFSFSLSLSLSLSLFLSILLVSFFLPCFLYLFVAFLFCFSLFALILCFCFIKRTTSNVELEYIHQSFLLFVFLSCFVFQISCYYHCFVAILSSIFLSTSMSYNSKKTTYKTPMLGENWGLQQFLK